MKPPRFGYHDPRTIEDVVGLLGSLDNARLLAGGQSMMPMLNMRFVLPDHLIDLSRVDALAGIAQHADRFSLGAMTRQRDLEYSQPVREHLPLVAEAIQWVGHRQTRNRGTLGGSLCQLDPSAELPAVCAALDATIHVRGPHGARSIAFAGFPAGYMTPAIEPDELVTAVDWPHWPRGHGWGFVEFARRHGDYAIVLAAALLTEDDEGRITRAVLVVGGIGPAPVRVTGVEQALLGEVAGETLFAAVCEQCRTLDAMADVHVPAAYRQQLAVVMSRRALLAAHARVAAGVPA
jgi:aerobic carbon-monoxide dehydrogenase medium subunit